MEDNESKIINFKYNRRSVYTPYITLSDLLITLLNIRRKKVVKYNSYNLQVITLTARDKRATDKRTS